MKRLKIYHISLLVIFSLLRTSIVTAFIVNNSIYEFKVENLNDMNNLYYYPFQDVMYSNGTFTEITDTLDIISQSSNIIVGKATGKSEVLQGAINTEIQILSQKKGNIKEDFIQIYEPLNIYCRKDMNGVIITYGGYTKIQEGREYIFCLQEGEDGVYMFLTPMLAKFPVQFNENNFYIDKEKQFDKNQDYRSYEHYDQLFETEQQWEYYQKIYEKIAIDDIQPIAFLLCQ